MTDKHINKLIAELDGWFNLDFDPNAYRGGGFFGRWIGNHTDNVSTDVTVYTDAHNHNDIHRVLDGLTGVEKTDASTELVKMATNTGVFIGAFILSASPREKCLAVLIAKGRVFLCKVCKDYMDTIHMGRQHGVCEKCDGKLVHDMDVD